MFAHTPARIVEFGAGSGVLARDLLDALAARGVAVERYSIVELSPDLAARQRALLEGRGVEWLTAPPRGFDGVMLANEVLDVMPVRLFVMRGRAPRERGVGLQGDALAFAERDADPELRDAVAAIEREVGELPDGYGSEIGFAGQAWMRSAADWLARGVLLAIDYGFPRREYYHPQRLMGTLMCHYRHRAHADPLWLPGLNDITAHVDFTAMADAAHAAGLDVLGYTTQAHFLMNCGLLEQLGAGHSLKRANEVQRLLSEAEMGELFKVLAVGRGVGETAGRICARRPPRAALTARRNALDGVRIAPRTLAALMKWLLTTFLALLILTALQPWLQKLGIGRLPGDVRITRKGREIVLPFTSTVLLTLLLTLLARLL